jgi:hypothetical protein
VNRSRLRVLSAVCSVAAAILFVDGDAAARSCRVNLIPNGNKNGCANCHVDPRGGGIRNAFGREVGPFVGFNCDEFFWPSVARLDSDGDGATNGEELEDPLGTWTLGAPPPGDPALVTNPGVVDRTPPPAFIRGDANEDGRVDLSDGVALLRSLFLDGEPSRCDAAADADDNGRLEVSDSIAIFSFLFRGARPLPAPFPSCGTRTGGPGCEGHSACE